MRMVAKVEKRTGKAAAEVKHIHKQTTSSRRRELVAYILHEIQLYSLSSSLEVILLATSS